jgi:hypothetical protein
MPPGNLRERIELIGNDTLQGGEGSRVAPVHQRASGTERESERGRQKEGDRERERGRETERGTEGDIPFRARSHTYMETDGLRNRWIYRYRDRCGCILFRHIQAFLSTCGVIY